MLLIHVYDIKCYFNQNIMYIYNHIFILSFIEFSHNFSLKLNTPFDEENSPFTLNKKNFFFYLL